MKTCNILIVDDDAVDRKATQRALEQAKWGGVIFQADSSLKALELMGAGKYWLHPFGLPVTRAGRA